MGGHGDDALVGRSEPCSRLSDAVARSAAGDRSAVFVSGTAGIGKTALIRSVLDDSVAPDTVVAWGTCWHGEGAPGFWPWMQAFDDLVRAVGTDEARRAAGDDLALMSSLVRRFDDAPGDIGGDPHQRRVLLLDAADRWIESLADERHLVVVLDDLHWADPSSLELLDYVIAAPVRTRLLVVGSYRHDELDPAVRRRLGAIVAHGQRIHLEGLDLPDLELLVTPIVGAGRAADLAAELHRRTGGHPLFTTELARLAALERSGTAGSSLPTAVFGAVTRRLGLLGAATRELLDVAAVLGNQLLPDVLGAVAGIETREVLARVEPAIDAGIVQHHDGGGLWFAHDLFRESLYAELDLVRRTELHHRVAGALEARHARGATIRPGDVAEHHCRALVLGGADAAVHWSRVAAADERSRSAFDEAAAHLHRVRAALDDAGHELDPGELVSLLLEEADDRARAGDPDAARALLARAREIAPGPHHRADIALAVQGLGARFAARRDAVVGQLDEALDAVAGLDPVREARLTAALARELRHSVAGDRLRAGPLSERALELGRASDDPATLLACLLARHDAIWEPGTGAERARLGREIAAIGASLGDLDREAEGLLLEANGLLEAGSAAYRSVLDRWFGLLEARDQPRDRYMVCTRRAALALLAADGAHARTLIDRAAELGEAVHEPDTGNVRMSQRVALSRLSDDPDELVSLARDAVAWWTGAPLLAHAVAAGAYAAAGRIDDAAREVAVVTGSGLGGEDSYLRSVLIGHLADAAVAMDDVDLCRTLLDEVAPLAGACGTNGAVVAFAGPFAHPAGLLAAAIGETERARRFLRSAVATARTVGAVAWARRSAEALESLDGSGSPGAPALRSSSRTGRGAATSTGVQARLTRVDRVWSVEFGDERCSVPHVKGMADIAVLVSRPGREVSALELAGGPDARGLAGRGDVLADRQALAAYRDRLAEIDAELDRAHDDADVGRLERLEDEREAVLSELRRVTGLGGRARTQANRPAERARKAVSARIRDAIRRLGAVAPDAAGHLDRSIRTGLFCSYDPDGEAEVSWVVDPG